MAGAYKLAGVNARGAPMGRRAQKRGRVTTEIVSDDMIVAIRASSEVLRRRQREHAQKLQHHPRADGSSSTVHPDELPPGSAQWLAQCAATPADLVSWLADMPACDCPSSDIMSWPKGHAAVFDGTPFGTRVAATRAALGSLHASAVQPLIDTGRLAPPAAFTLERLVWARGKHLRACPPPAALSTSVRLWCGLPLVRDNPLDTFEVFVTTLFPLTCETEASLLRARLGHLQDGDGIGAVECEQTALEDGRPGARVRAGPFVLRRHDAVSCFV